MQECREEDQITLQWSALSKKTPRIARGLVFLKAGSKADSSYISEFHSARCQRKSPAARTDSGRRTELHCNGWRSAKTAPTRARLCESESWDPVQQFLRGRILFFALLAKNCSKCTKQLLLVTDAFSYHKTILKVQQASPIRSFTFLNAILILETLKSFIHECLCFTSCQAHPHKIHDRLQKRQIMIQC